MIYRLYEDIYGNKATVYHRSKEKDLISKIYNTGFKVGTGEYYGEGFYSTFDLKSQQNEYMKDMYGYYIIKFYVSSLYNFISFEYDEFVKLPIAKRLEDWNEENFINKQLESIEVFDKFIPKEFSSDILDKVWRKIYRKVDGVIYSGRKDGKCLLSYNTEILYPYKFSEDNGITFKSVEKNMDYLKKTHDINIDNFKGVKDRRNIFYYINNRDINALKKYIEEKKDINIKDKYGRTLLTIASTIGNIEMVKILIEVGADVNLQDTDLNDTPLIMASMTQNVEIVKLLLDAGADVNLENILNNTALDIAKERNNEEIINLLKQYGATK